MNNTGEIIKIVIMGTKKSLALDLDERNEIIFQPGEKFRPGINTTEDMTSQSLSSDPIFANYDYSDLFEKVSLIKMRLTDHQD